VRMELISNVSETVSASVIGVNVMIDVTTCCIYTTVSFQNPVCLSKRTPVGEIGGMRL
jgi:hypothetical protein